MMIHTTSESDLASIITPSSSSPKAYYVQSPSSRDLHDDTDKCSSSNSRWPSDSPSYPRHSAASSSSTAASCSHVSGNRRRWNKHYCNVVAEEKGNYDDDYYGDRGCSILGKFLLLVLGFGMAFGGLCLVIWGTSRPYKPQVSIKSLMVHNVYFGEGSDHTGVPTKLLTVNSSAIFVIYNPARFFGIHVSSRATNLIFSQIAVATGQMKKYYQPKRSKRILWVRVVGQGVPLYGAGLALAAADASGGIPFRFEFEVDTIGYLLGKLVETKHRRRASCSLVINSKRTKQIIFKHDSCQYGL